MRASSVEAWTNFERLTFSCATAIGPKGEDARHFGVVRFSADTDPTGRIDLPVDGGYAALGPEQGKLPGAWFAQARAETLPDL